MYWPDSMLNLVTENGIQFPFSALERYLTYQSEKAKREQLYLLVVVVAPLHIHPDLDSCFKALAILSSVVSLMDRTRALSFGTISSLR